MSCPVREGKAVLHLWFGKCYHSLYYECNKKKNIRKGLFSALVSETLRSLKGPRYKSSEGFKASKVILAWVGCRSCVTTREKVYGGVFLNLEE